MNTAYFHRYKDLKFIPAGRVKENIGHLVYYFEYCNGPHNYRIRAIGEHFLKYFEIDYGKEFSYRYKIN